MDHISRFANENIAWHMKQFSTVIDETGELGVIEYEQEFDFLVKRTFFLRNIKEGEVRGLHSHKELKQLIVCLSGSFTIHLDCGVDQKSFKMDSSSSCLFLDGKVWREMSDFSKDAVMLVLCDREYRYDEVVRSYSQFQKNLEEVNRIGI
jgi:dTDP-4-dehydrorhamnose 3,5-epimerase-like enzyme